MVQGKRDGAARSVSLWVKRWLRHPLEAAFLSLLFAILWALPIDAASNFGGWLGRALGPHLRGDRRARVNLALAMPTLTPEQVDAVLRGMWDNLGRVLGEYPHLGRIADPSRGRVILRGEHHLEPFRGSGAAAILLAAHQANWEILPAFANRCGVPVTVVARALNNPLADGLIKRCRKAYGRGWIDKGSGSGRQVLAALRNGHVVGILGDQKFNRGIDLPFFGQPAPTADAPAQLSLRTGAPVLPVQIMREGPGRFVIVCHPPLENGDEQVASRERALAMMGDYHRHLEGWIGERPAEWLWIHRRWPKAFYARERLEAEAEADGDE